MIKGAVAGTKPGSQGIPDLLTGALVPFSYDTCKSQESFYIPRDFLKGRGRDNKGGNSELLLDDHRRLYCRRESIEGLLRNNQEEGRSLWEHILSFVGEWEEQLSFRSSFHFIE